MDFPYKLWISNDLHIQNFNGFPTSSWLPGAKPSGITSKKPDAVPETASLASVWRWCRPRRATDVTDPGDRSQSNVGRGAPGFRWRSWYRSVQIIDNSSHGVNKNQTYNWGPRCNDVDHQKWWFSQEIVNLASRTWVSTLL